MMVTAVDGTLLCTDFRSSQLPLGCIGSKVDKIARRPRACFAPADVLEGLVTSRLRELIQQLGEAIHESVIESEQIAGVVQDIRRHGFDVLLMLEATIGLNEVAAKDSEDAESGAQTDAEGGPFTRNDVNFLRSLRISVEGEEGESADQTGDTDDEAPGE